MSTQKKITMDQVVAAYIQTRDQIAEINRAVRDQVAALNKLQEKREQWLAAQLQIYEGQGLEPSVRTTEGSVFYTTKEFIQSEDWETTLQHIIDHKLWDFLTKALSKQAVLDAMGAERDITKVPGIKYTAVKAVTVRR
jgi:hypothetical protein